MRPAIVAAVRRTWCSRDRYAEIPHRPSYPRRNTGASVELSIDREQWQYFTELGVLAVSFGNDFGDGLRGTMYRGGVGMRHIARRFDVGNLRMELGLEAVAALQAIDWFGDGREMRPELDAGFSWNFVFLNRVAFRTSVRVAVSSSTTEPTCRAACPIEATPTASYMIVTGLSW